MPAQGFVQFSKAQWAVLAWPTRLELLAARDVFMVIFVHRIYISAGDNFTSGDQVLTILESVGAGPQVLKGSGIFHVSINPNMQPWERPPPYFDNSERCGFVECRWGLRQHLWRHGR